MKPRLYIYLLSALLAGVSCSKCNKADVVTSRNIEGVVINNCTDSGLADVTVRFETFRNGNLVNTEHEISGANGAFRFVDAQFHSDPAYTYALHIKSQSGAAAQLPEHTRFDGTTMYFKEADVAMSLNPRVTPGFLFFRLHFKRVNQLSASDSLFVRLTQNTFHRNVPVLPHQITGSSAGTTDSQSGLSGNYPMGLYEVEIEKTVGGVYSKAVDTAVYLPWKSVSSYTVFW